MSRCRHRGTTLVVTNLGFDVRIDDETIDALGELRAVLAGRRTFTRHVQAGEVHHRGPYEIRTRPAGSHPRQTVHVQHRCPTSETMTGER